MPSRHRARAQTRRRGATCATGQGSSARAAGKRPPPAHVSLGTTCSPATIAGVRGYEAPTRAGKAVVTGILKALRSVPGLVVRKRHGTAMGMAGDPDLYGSLAGAPLRDRGEAARYPASQLTALQAQRLEECEGRAPSWAWPAAWAMPCGSSAWWPWPPSQWRQRAHLRPGWIWSIRRRGASPLFRSSG